MIPDRKCPIRHAEVISNRERNPDIVLVMTVVSRSGARIVPGTWGQRVDEIKSCDDPHLLNGPFTYRSSDA
ncbi:hypothetical protein CDAR_571751 [Caerostris darwini]|uniref:Uncharacterized protein n=1 Tax=Caerostris darwini TaxID=1538125 RepID=A0AAV4W4S0_9ARAC|nr:hypothetical protein CDAR_571751 [Caerostris darwini]